MDPFLSWQSTDVPSLKDPSRYLPIKTMPLENLQDSGGVTNPFQISDANTVTQGTSNTSGNGVSLTTGASFNIGGFGFSTKTTDSWTWSITESTAQISTTAQTASATLLPILPIAAQIRAVMWSAKLIYTKMLLSGRLPSSLSRRRAPFIHRQQGTLCRRFAPARRREGYDRVADQRRSDN
jgi:hypothetical protein